MAENRDDLDLSAAHNDEFDRGMPSLNRSGSGGIGQKILFGIGAVFVVLALVAVNGGFSSEGNEKVSAVESNDEIGNRLGPAPELPAPPVPPEAPQEKPEQPEEKRNRK